MIKFIAAIVKYIMFGVQDGIDLMARDHISAVSYLVQDCG